MEKCKTYSAFPPDFEIQMTEYNLTYLDDKEALL